MVISQQVSYKCNLTKCWLSPSLNPWHIQSDKMLTQSESKPMTGTAGQGYSLAHWTTQMISLLVFNIRLQQLAKAESHPGPLKGQHLLSLIQSLFNVLCGLHSHFRQYAAVLPLAKLHTMGTLACSWICPFMQTWGKSSWDYSHKQSRQRLN